MRENKKRKYKTRRRTPEERYRYRVRKEDYKLEDFLKYETEWANDLILWYKVKKLDMPDDEYRGCAFFINREFNKKPGSLTLVYEMYKNCRENMPAVTKENAFDLVRYNFMMYAKVLSKGGFG